MAITNKQRDVLAGGTPGDFGYKWDGLRKGWFKPWAKDTAYLHCFEILEWNRYIPKGR
jgi:hypothetical protein